MTKTTERTLRERLRGLCDEWKDWTLGRTSYHWYGMVPWCQAGAKGRCTDPTCEGCSGVVETRWQLARIEAQVAPVKVELDALAALRAAKKAKRNPSRPVQEALFA